MAYNSSYSTGDVTSVTIDGLVIFGITVIGFAGLIALVMLYKWARKNVK
jgi:hypothetical protein